VVFRSKLESITINKFQFTSGAKITDPIHYKRKEDDKLSTCGKKNGQMFINL